MMRFDQLLRETVDEMADEMKGPAAGLAHQAMARGRRIRRARLATATGGLMAACAVAILLPWAILGRPQGAPLTNPTPPATGAVANGLPGGWVVTGVGPRVLDRASGTYLQTEGPPARVIPAPVGGRVLIQSQDISVRLMDVAGTNKVNVDDGGFSGNYRWAPGGDRLVGGVTQREPFKVGFAIIDAATGAITKHWVDLTKYDCSTCSFSWTRDGREVVLAIADRSGGEAAERVSSLQLFDAKTGVPTRSLPVTAMPSSPFSWSPNGLYVVASTDGFGGPWQLVDTVTGQSRPFRYDAVWVTDNQLLAPVAGGVVTMSPDGTVVETTPVAIPGGSEPISLGPPA